MKCAQHCELCACKVYAPVRTRTIPISDVIAASPLSVWPLSLSPSLSLSLSLSISLFPSLSLPLSLSAFNSLRTLAGRTTWPPVSSNSLRILLASWGGISRWVAYFDVESKTRPWFHHALESSDTG